MLGSVGTNFGVERVSPCSDLKAEKHSLRDRSKSEAPSKSAFTIVRDLYKTTRNLPPRIQAICWVQFWSWIGWFPFLFYGSTWVGEIYLRYDAPAPTNPTAKDALADVGRVGSMSLIVFSIVSFGFSILLPYLAHNPDAEREKAFTPRPPRSLEPCLEQVPAWKPTLPTAWMIANIMFALSMVFAPMVHSVHFATVLVAICGLPWAIGGWASFALMGTEINKLSTTLPTSNAAYRRLSTDSVEMDPLSEDSPPRTLHLRHDSVDNDANGSTGELAGVYLGILNIFTTMPQFVGTGISTVVFAILEPGKSPELAHDSPKEEHHAKDGVSGIGVCLFIGAVCAGWAAWRCRRLGR